MTRSYDAIVIGAGLAGLSTARALSKAGHEVAVLEGRDRIGGRTLYRAFPGTELKVDFGGTWVSPKHNPRIAREMQRYGLGLAPPAPEAGFRWHLDGRLSRSFPLGGEQLYELERALFEIMRAARRVDPARPSDEQDLADLDVSVHDFLSELGLSRRTFDFLAAFGSLGSGADSRDWSALTAFTLMAGFGYSAFAWFAGVVDKLAGGTASLVEPILEDSAADLELGVRVGSLTGHEDRVSVTADDGRSWSAATAVVAVPVNTWRDMDFGPVSEAKQELRRTGHPNRMGKVWALVEGAPGGELGFGRDTDLLFLAPQYRVGDRELMVGFSSPPARLDVGDRDAVQDAVRQFFPDADVVTSSAHDWNADPYSLGGWLTYPPGLQSRSMSALQAPEGRLSFAGADLATCWIGWMEGALESADRAAAQASRWLAS